MDYEYREIIKNSLMKISIPQKPSNLKNIISQTQCSPSQLFDINLIVDTL